MPIRQDSSETFANCLGSTGKVRLGVAKSVKSLQLVRGEQTTVTCLMSSHRSISLLRLTAAAKCKIQPRIQTGSHSSLQRGILT